MLLSLSLSEILSHPRENHPAHPRLGKQLVDESSILG
jgi:hypothetical protein